MARALALVNGRVYTQEHASPRGQAVGVVGNRIAAVGSNEAALDVVGASADRIDLHGRTVIPGFVDAHFHLLAYCLSRERLQLEGAETLESALGLVGQAAVAAPPRAWVVGRGWDRNLWPGAAFPSRHDLDRVARGRPVFLLSRDAHAVWVNTAALELAGLGRDTPDPPGGRILREPNGTPSGILLEEAGRPLRELADQPSLEASVASLHEGQDALLRVGVTAVHSFEGARAFEALQVLDSRGELRLRVFAGLPSHVLAAASRIGLRTGFGSQRLRVGLLKLFADGALGSGTAAMLAPYTDSAETNDRGIARLELEELIGLMREAREAGIGVAIHAIGDAAVRSVLDAAETVRSEEPGRQQILRIEHAQLVDPDDLGRFGRLDVVASMQPLHVTSDMRIADRRWGSRCRTAYPWRSVLEAGARLAFGTDCPVEPPDPFRGVHAAATRQLPDGDPPGGWHPEQRLTVPEAVRAYTLGSADAAGLAHEHGSVATGKLADLLVLSADPYAIPPEELFGISVEMTIFDGQVVYAM